jgi:hypothetical protein
MTVSRDGNAQGFVEFASADNVDRAVGDFNQAEINGRVINVRAISGGGGGRGGGGRGGGGCGRGGLVATRRWGCCSTRGVGAEGC